MVLTRFDETCGELLNYLDREGLANDTLVLYLADNGWITDPKTGRYAAKSKQSPYDGGLRTPIMVRWKGRLAPKTNAETQPKRPEPRRVFLENGEVRIGMDLALGGAVTFLSSREHPGNLINNLASKTPPAWTFEKDRQTHQASGHRGGRPQI
jgi:hypothetical protein